MGIDIFRDCGCEDKLARGLHCDIPAGGYLLNLATMRGSEPLKDDFL